MANNTDRLVLLAVAESEVEATIWRDALKQEGIPALVKTRDPLAAIGVPVLNASLEVYVSARDEQRARWVLGDRQEPGEAEPLSSDSQEHTRSRD